MLGANNLNAYKKSVSVAITIATIYILINNDGTIFSTPSFPGHAAPRVKKAFLAFLSVKNSKGEKERVCVCVPVCIMCEV